MAFDSFFDLIFPNFSKNVTKFAKFCNTISYVINMMTSSKELLKQY